jgi:1-acyl-sn-glycerol-3-phosphate acyltransferase
VTGVPETKTDTTPEPSVPPKQAPDTYFLLETAGNLFIHLMGGLFVQGEENVPRTGPVLMVSNHTSYLDPVGIGVASPRRVVFMAKAPLFKNKPLAFLLRGVDCFPVRRGEADRTAFKTTMTMLEEGRVVCIFPEGTRYDGIELGEAEPGAALFAIRTGCPVVPVFVRGAHLMLGKDDKPRRGKITIAFGEPFTIPKKTDREEGGRMMMEAIARTRDAFADAPSRQIKPHWFRKKPEGSRAR